jgi:hypothetical protein
MEEILDLPLFTRKIRVRVWLKWVWVINESPIYNMFSKRVVLCQPADIFSSQVDAFDTVFSSSLKPKRLNMTSTLKALNPKKSRIA